MYNICIESFYSNWPRPSYKIHHIPYIIFGKVIPTPEFYRILDIKIDATPELIKKAYRQKALETHPDKGGNEEKFKKIQEVYETLSDPHLRELYNIMNFRRV
jgi:preprotein translocase subunit Sec63